MPRHVKLYVAFYVNLSGVKVLHQSSHHMWDDPVTISILVSINFFKFINSINIITDGSKYVVISKKLLICLYFIDGNINVSLVLQYVIINTVLYS